MMGSKAGVEFKPLLFDRVSGLASILMRMTPGATLPDHEHVCVEQTWVLEGHLVDKSGPDEGIECKAGQFIWRPAGSRHSAWSPNGGLMLGCPTRRGSSQRARLSRACASGRVGLGTIGVATLADIVDSKLPAIAIASAATRADTRQSFAIMILKNTSSRRHK